MKALDKNTFQDQEKNEIDKPTSERALRINLAEINAADHQNTFFRKLGAESNNSDRRNNKDDLFCSNKLGINTNQYDNSKMSILYSSPSPRKASLSRFSKRLPGARGSGLRKKRNSKKRTVEITLQELLFKLKLDRFIKNIRAHAGMNDVSRLTLEKLRIINDQGASESQILSEKTSNEMRKKNEAMIKRKASTNERISMLSTMLNSLSQEARALADFVQNWAKNLYNFLEDAVPIFKPFGKFKIVWEILMLLLTVWNLISLSLILSFSINLQESFSLSIGFFNNEKSLLGFQIICFVLYNIDILIKFNTSIYKDGEPVYNRKLIFKSYSTSGLLFDLLGTFPFWQSLRDLNSVNNVHLFFLLFKLYPLQMFFKNINEALLSIEGKLEAAYHLIKLLLTVLTVCHIFACIWHFQALEISYGEKNWITNLKLQDAIWSERYLKSLYFTVVTMTTVGYGDISPSNTFECFVAMACMLIGSGLIGYSINSIGAIIKKKNKGEIDFRYKMQLVNVYLKKNNIEEALKIRVRKYLEYIWRIENSAKEKKCEEILKELPNSLREELLTQSRTWALKNLFGGKFSNATIRKLVNNLTHVQFSKEEWIFQEGEKDTNLLVIAKGSVDLVLNEGKSTKTKYIKLSTKMAGDIIGVTSFILETPTKVSAKAASVCTLFKLSKSKFIEIIKENPEEYETYCMIRDKMLLYNDMSIVGRKCRSCGDIDHSIRYCSHLTYKPFKDILLKRHLYSAMQGRKSFKRAYKGKRVFSKNLLDLRDVQETVMNFQNQKLADITSLQEFYSYYNENYLGFPSVEISNSQNEDYITDLKGRDDSKEITIASRDEYSNVDDNIKGLTENIPFKSLYPGLKELEKEVDVKIPMPIVKQEENTIFRQAKFNQLTFYPSSPNIKMPHREENTGFEFRNEDFSKKETHHFKKTLKIHLEENSPSKRPLDDRSDKKVTMTSGLRSPKMMFDFLVGGDAKISTNEYDVKDEPDRGVKVKGNKTLSLFSNDFDSCSAFSIYFPQNNKQAVLERMKRKKGKDNK